MWHTPGNFPVLRRYLMFQIPGCTLAAGVLYALVRFWGLAPRTAALLFALWIAKELALYPLLRSAYAGTHRDVTDRMIGSSASVCVALDPQGYVRLGAELWRAEVAPGHAPVAPGARVRVDAVHGLTLHVTPE
jgi:membrane protein implicated in regulation of membrane protease activity